MVNNYIKHITISDENNYIIIYFKNNVYNPDGNYLSNNNFKIYLKDSNIYEELIIENIIKNDSNSYSIFFNINNNFNTNNSQIFIELIDIISNNNKKLNNIQSINSVYINVINDTNNIEFDLDIKEFNNNKNIKTKKIIIQETPYVNYINKSSPLLAFNNNKIQFYKNQINQYNNFYGKKISKYPKSYYLTSYNKIYKPSPQT